MKLLVRLFNYIKSFFFRKEQEVESLVIESTFDYLGPGKQYDIAVAMQSNTRDISFTFTRLHEAYPDSTAIFNPTVPSLLVKSDKLWNNKEAAIMMVHKQLDNPPRGLVIVVVSNKEKEVKV